MILALKVIAVGNTADRINVFFSYDYKFSCMVRNRLFDGYKGMGDGRDGTDKLGGWSGQGGSDGHLGGAGRTWLSVPLLDGFTVALAMEQWSNGLNYRSNNPKDFYRSVGERSWKNV